MLRDCYEDARLIGNIVTYNVAAGILIEQCHDIVVSANQLEENQDALRCTDSFNLCMTGNNVDDHRTGIALDGAGDVTITGNIFGGLTTPAIAAKNGCQRLLIANNLIADANRGGEGKGRKTIDLGDARESLVKDNLGN